MHLLETYALSTGSKIKKPFIIEKYFPLPFDKYITIQNSSGMTGKCYDYFQDVIDFLIQKLKNNGYSIVQIGAKNDTPLNKVYNLQGQTDINQTAYILKNSSLHIGNDSFAIHMCSAFNTPLIGLYSISSPEIAGPYWKNTNQICLTPNNWKPSFNPNESPKRVNEIKIEKIIESCNKLLFDNNQDIKIETIYIGKNYNNLILESLPNQIVPKEFLPNHLLNIRVDFLEDIDAASYNGMLNNLNIRPCSIITDKPLNLETFLHFKEKVSIIFYDITKNINIDFINNLNNLGFKSCLIFRLNNNNNNNNDLILRKFDLIDFPQQIEIFETSAEIQKLIKNTKDNLFFKSKKILCAKDQIYPGRAAYLENVPINNLEQNLEQNLNSIKNIEHFFLEDIEYSMIYKKIID